MRYKEHSIGSLKTMVDKEVKTAGWVQDVRDLGKVKFVILRDSTGVVQITAKKGVVDENILNYLDVNKEDVLYVHGKVIHMKNAPGGIELIPIDVKILSKVERKLPIDLTERIESDIDVRLDYRYVDLRRKKIRAIFDVVSKIPYAFREKLLELGFQEIRPPCIVASATEGGSNLFPIVYFEREAFLSQSPQLYKQMAVIGGMEKVFMTTYAFRAEKHNTTFHLNEVLQMDIEMAFADHFDVMKILSDVALHIVKKVKSDCKEQLDTLGVDLKVDDEVKMISYDEAINLLSSEFDIEWGQDFSREHEEFLCKKLGKEFVMVYEYPTMIRAFYSMPLEDNEEKCKAFDLLYRGTEISSGAQRIHVPELLIKQLKKRDLAPEKFEYYINAFRYGAPPHAGWSIGLERFAMKIVNVTNIREVVLFPRDRTRLVP
ncbi:MAG: aspartate--tRNA(Asn) ligase [Candidatus Micrarchaeota archaeon]|nr:aspartate--tRNA(Asn) ligase [Candidatus Micrarchaeota archaeon]